MQPQHLIILIGLIMGFALLTFFVNKVIKRELRKAYATGRSAGIADSSDRMDAINGDLASLAVRRSRERKSLLETIELKNHLVEQLQEELAVSGAGTLTKSDLQVLLDTATTLGLAHKTWLPIRGTEPWRARAATQLEQLNGIAHRILAVIREDRSAVPVSDLHGGKTA